MGSVPAVSEDDLLRQSVFMFVAISVANLFHLIYHLFMVRTLSPVDYGILNSLITMLMFISQPLSTLSTVVTKFVSEFNVHNKTDKIKQFLVNLGKKVFIIGSVVFIVILVGSGRIATFLQIPYWQPVALVSFILFFSIPTSLITGSLQGLEEFVYLGGSVVIGAMIRLVLAIVLVIAGFGVCGALYGFLFSTIFFLFLPLFLTIRALKKKKFGFTPLEKVYPISPVRNNRYQRVPISNGIRENSLTGVAREMSAQSEIVSNASEIDYKKIYKYFIPVAISTFCLIALTNIDIILVKHFFEPIKAGFYSIAQMVGKIILFLPAAISIVMFPKVSGLYAKGKPTLHILNKSLLYVGILCGFGIAISLLFPEHIIKLLTGKIYPECVPLVRLFALAMGIYALVVILTYYHLSIHNSKFIYPLLIFTGLQTLLICLFHNSLVQVLYILIATASILFIIGINIAKIRKVPA